MEKSIFRFSNAFRDTKTRRWLGLLTFCMMLFVGQMGFAQTYCTTSFASGCTDDHIDDFTIPDVGFSHLDTGCSTNQYGDYTAMTIAFNAGESYSFTTTHGWTSQNVRIWIDFNNDGVFSDDATERVSSASGGYTTNGTISIPGDVSGGTFRMRVATRFSSAPVPCNTAGYGETHDYMASITVPTCPAPTALTASNPTLTSIDLSWNGVGGASGNYEIKWGAVGFDIDAATAILVTGLSHTLNGTEGNYEFVVREICSVNDASAWSSRKAFRIPSVGEDCSAPIVVGALPYTTTDDTANYTDNPNIEGSPGSSGCGTTSVYLNGNDVVYAYTATFDGVINVKLSGLTATYAGIFAYASCADIGAACIGGAFNGSSSSDISFEMNVTSGGIYYFVISTWASPQTVGYTLDISQVLCAKPTGVDHADVTHNSANVSWDVLGNYEINWGTGTFVAGEGANTDTVNATTEFAFSGLNGSTLYRYFVRQNCGGASGNSEWSGPYTFTTLAAPASIPWLEPFAGTTFPANWSNISSWTVGASTTIVPGAEGSYLYKEIYGTTGTNGAMFSTLRMGLVSAGDILNFNYGLRKYSGSYTASGTISIEVSTDNGVTYSPFQTITHSDDVAWTSSEQFDLSAYAGENIRIRITAKRTGSTDDYYLGFDNFYVGQPITCEAPSALTATNITANTADLSWTSEGSTFDISWGTGTFDAEDGTIVSLANGGTLSGLAPQTTYRYYVRQNCGIGDFSLWAGPFSFTTACDSFTSINENFDSYTTGNIVPDCWVRLVPATSVGSQTITTTTPASGTRNIYQYATAAQNPVIVVLPSFSNVNDGTHWLKFKARVGSGAPGALHVGYVTDATDYDSFVLIETLAITNTSYTTDADYSVIIPTSVPAGAKLAIKNAADAKSYYWDDVIWEEAPSCIPPSALTASNITTNTADLSWTSEGSTFDISWGAGAFDAEDGTIVSLANGGTLSGLTAQTTYQYYVRQNCGVGDVSMWVGPFGFTTACEAFDLPYSQDFEGVTAPSLPSCTSIETLNGNPWRTSSSTVTGMTGNKLNYTYHASGTGTADAWFYTPGLNLEAGKNYAISYKYGNNSTSWTERMKVAYGTSAMASVMNEVLADHNAINSTGVSENEVFFTVAEDGVYYFGFQSYSIANQNQLYVDDILIRELGDDCTGTPEAGIATISVDSGISGSAVDFAVTGYENETEGLTYDWEYSVDNGVTWNSTGASDNEVTFTITGTIGTVFQVRYAVTCSFSESTAYSNAVTFTVSQPLEYCTPTYTDFTYDDRLSVVTTTGAVSNLNYSNTVRSQHFDMTTMILETTPGQQFTLSTTYVGGEQTVGIWIDWENNNTFDDLGNRIALNYSGSTGQTFTVTIPSDAALGDYRLRVRGSYGNHTADGDAFACNSKSYGSSVDFTIRIAIPCSSEWTGAVSTDWNTAGNWCDNTVPSNTSDVTINSETTNFPVITTDVNVASITIADGASVTVNSGTFTVGDITIENGGEFVFKHNASLWQEPTAVNSGNVTIQKELTIKHLDYTVWSSPVSGSQTLQQYSPHTLPNRIRTYNGPGVGTWVTTNVDAAFTTGKGYMFRAPNADDNPGTPYTWTGSFVGTPNNQDVTVIFSSVADYQAVGNPYPTSISADDFITYGTNDGNIGTLYFWDTQRSEANRSGGAAWATYNYETGATSADGGAEPSGIIPSGQGFLVEVLGGNSVDFTTGMRVDDQGTFFRTATPERHRLWLNLSNQDMFYNQTLVAYINNATNGLDARVDAKMLDNTGTALYSLIDNQATEYVIQARALPFNDLDVVPMGFRAIEAGTYTISLANFDGLFAEGQEIFIKDNMTQATQNLKDGSYTFASEAGTFESRFEVVYRLGSLSTETPQLNNNWVVYAKDGKFTIETVGFEMKQVVVYDMLGRTVYQSAAEGKLHNVANIGANQVLIVKVITTENTELTKKVSN